MPQRVHAGATPIIVLAHGSRHPDADAAVASLALATQDRAGVPVLPAYLDFSAVTLEFAAQRVRALGYRQAVVVPLLFTDAFHLRHDVPSAVHAAQENTGVELLVASGIGTGHDVAELLAAVHGAAVADTGAGSGARYTQLLVFSVGSSVPEANAAVRDLARRVAWRVHAGSFRVLHATGPTAGSWLSTEDSQEMRGKVPAGQPQQETSPIRGTYMLPLFFSPATLWDSFRAEVTAQARGAAQARGTVLGEVAQENAGEEPMHSSCGDGIRWGAPLGNHTAPLILARATQALGHTPARSCAAGRFRRSLRPTWQLPARNQQQAYAQASAAGGTTTLWRPRQERT